MSEYLETQNMILLKERDALRAELEQAKAERDRLLPLARFAALSTPDTRVDELNIVEDVWDAAVESGLIIKRTDACPDDDCSCEGSGECWVFAPGVAETMEELRRG